MQNQTRREFEESVIHQIEHPPADETDQQYSRSISALINAIRVAHRREDLIRTELGKQGFKGSGLILQAVERILDPKDALTLAERMGFPHPCLSAKQAS